MFYSPTARFLSFFGCLVMLSPLVAHAQRGSALPQDVPLLFEEGYRLAPGDSMCTSVNLSQLRDQALFVPGTETAAFDTTRLSLDVGAIADSLSFSTDTFQESLDALLEQAEQVLTLVENISESTEVCAVGMHMDSLPTKLQTTLGDLGLTAEYAATITATGGDKRLETLVLSGTESGVPVPVAIEGEVLQNGISVRHEAAFFQPGTFVIPDTLDEGEPVVMVMDVLTYDVNRRGDYEQDTSMPDYQITITGAVETVGGMTIPLPRKEDIVITEAYRFNLEGSAQCIADCGAGKSVSAMGSRYLFMYVHDAGETLYMDAKLMYESRLTGWAMREGYVYGEGAAATQVERIEAPLHIQLHGNYPNPFNPTTTIRYALSAAQHVHVAVYDALGRQVDVLADGWQGAGEHHAVFDATGQASGLYFYRITTGPHVSQTRVMTLVK